MNWVGGALVVVHLFVLCHSKEVEIITEPKPGQEYVQISAQSPNKPIVKESKSVVMTVTSSKSSSFKGKTIEMTEDQVRAARQAHHHTPKVQVTDEGKTGILKNAPLADPVEKHILEAKRDHKLSNKKEIPGKKETRLNKNEETDNTYKREESYVTLPPYKHVQQGKNGEVVSLLKDNFEIIGLSSNRGKIKDEGNFDFIDSPLSDKNLTPAGTSQASRINVKKGPNGQDYEYEYVYYYYDEEDDDLDKKDDDKDQPKPREGAPDKASDKAPEANSVRHDPKPVTLQPETVQPTHQHSAQQHQLHQSQPQLHHQQPQQQLHHQQLHHQQPQQQLHQQTQPHLHQHQHHHHPQQQQEASFAQPQHHQNFPQTTFAQPQPTFSQPQQHHAPSFQTATPQAPTRTYQEQTRRPIEAQDQEAEFGTTRGRSRYTNIERGRGEVAVTTQEPTHNEIVPTRNPHRGRGRGSAGHHVSQEEESSDERAPSGGRFTSRARNQLTTLPPPTEVPVTQRARIQGGSVRRPSLELVDSSSFRTHSSDVPHQQEISTAYNQPPSRGGNVPANRGRFVEDTRESDLPEYIEEVRTTQSRPRQPTVAAPQPRQPTTLPEQVPVTTIRYIDSPHQEEPIGLPPQAVPIPLEEVAGLMPEKAAFDLYALLQNSHVESSANEVETESFTEEILTEPPTTTTTTTTTTTPPPTQRGRFNGRVGTRSRVRTTPHQQTTTEQPQEQNSRTRGRFQPSSGRTSSQSAYGGRRGTSTKVTSTSAPEPEVEATPRSRPSFSSNRFRTRARPTGGSASTTTEAPVPAAEPVEVATPRPRPRVNPAVRPLRPGPRINIGSSRARVEPAENQPSHPPPPPPPPQQQNVQEESGVEQGGAIEVSTDSALTRLRNRPRLRISAAAQRPAPQQIPAARRQLPHGLAPRRRPETEVVEEEEEIEPQVVETTPSATEAPQPPPQPEPISPVSSLIRRRRPLPGLRRPQPDQ